MKIKRPIYILRKGLVLLPFILLFLAEILNFTNNSLGALIKVLAILYMLFYSIAYEQFNRNLVFVTLLFIPFLFYHIFISFNYFAALESGLRYIFPIVILFYGFSVRKHYKTIIGFIIIYALINDIYQIYVYYNWANGVQHQWFYRQIPGTDTYSSNSSMGILRGVGLLGFFATFGFLNLIAFFLTREFYRGKYKIGLLIIFSLGLLSSISFKTIGAFVVLLFILSKHKLKLLGGILGLILITITLFPQKGKEFKAQAVFRIKAYITEGNSARADSYRVMFQDIADLRLLGRGAGSFGGAASTEYKSPVYKEVNFNWYRTPDLATTDTYYPHLFVELGIIGALLYLLIIVTPILKRHYTKEVLLLIFAIYFGLLFESFFSFALNNTGYLMLSLILIYPILEYEKNPVHRKLIEPRPKIDRGS